MTASTYGFGFRGAIRRITAVAEYLTTSRCTIRTYFLPVIRHNIQPKILLFSPLTVCVYHSVLVVGRVTALSVELFCCTLGEVLGSNLFVDVERVPSLKIKLGLLS